MSLEGNVVNDILSRSELSGAIVRTKAFWGKGGKEGEQRRSLCVGEPRDHWTLLLKKKESHQALLFMPELHLRTEATTPIEHFHRSDDRSMLNRPLTTRNKKTLLVRRLEQQRRFSILLVPLE